MINQLLQVSRFCKLAGIETNAQPVDIVPQGTVLRQTELGQKCANEFIAAFSPGGVYHMKVNQRAALEALCARLYVLLGDAHVLGLSYLLPVAFRMLHNSNMTKFWREEEVRAIPEFYTVNCVAPNSLRPYAVFDPLGQLVKSPSYEPAHMGDLLDELGGQELLDFNHAVGLFFGDEPEPDIDEPKNVTLIDIPGAEDDDDLPF